MYVQISIRHMLSSCVNKRAVRELCSEVRNKYANIQFIDVMLEDINGPHKAGIDKRCHLKVRGKDHLAIDIEDIDEDITCAIDRAFRRLKNALERYHSYRISGHVNGRYSIEA